MTGDPSTSSSDRLGGLFHGRGAIVAAATVVTLIVGVVTLWDRFATPAPTPGPTTGPSVPSGPASFSGELSDHAEAISWITFVQDHDGETVELDMSCTDDFETSSCFVGPGANPGEAFLWIFTNERCFIESEDEADLESCGGANVFMFGETEGTSFVMANGPSGAGSVIFKGDSTIRIRDTAAPSTRSTSARSR